MRHQTISQPVILLLDGGPSSDNKFVKRWFEKSRFLTCEASDIFHALEEVSDFTTPQRPDVILLEVASMPEDFRVVKMMIQTPNGQMEMPILAWSETGNVINDQACFEGNLTQLAAQLERLFPPCAGQKQAIAA